MKPKLHPAYRASLPFSICLQIGFLALAYTVHPPLVRAALIPAVAYWLITPIVMLRHPTPSRLDLQMVRTGYAFYIVLTAAMAGIYASFSR